MKDITWTFAYANNAESQVTLHSKPPRPDHCGADCIRMQLWDEHGDELTNILMTPLEAVDLATALGGAVGHAIEQGRPLMPEKDAIGPA